MLLKGIVDEDFVQYKKPSMFIATSKCDWKCCNEIGADTSICQNEPIARQKNISISAGEIYRRYTSNDISKAITFGGLEPFLQFEEMLEVIKTVRENNCLDDIVIYTGYYKDEIKNKIDILKNYKNIIIKFGRFIPNSKSRFDNIIGVTLASENQYAEKVS